MNEICTKEVRISQRSRPTVLRSVLVGLLLVCAGLRAQETPAFVYVTNNVLKSVSVYQINPGTGKLTLVGATPSGVGAASIAVTPDQRFLYVNFYEAGFISGFSINSVTGLLTPLPGSPFQAESPAGIVVHPNGKLLFVSTIFSGVVVGFRIDQSTGALTRVSELPVVGNRLAIDPEGKFLYVPSSLSNEILVVAVDSTTGGLTSVASYPTGQYPVQAVVDPLGRFVYTTNGASPPGSISGYSRNAITGMLAPIPGSPFPLLGSWTMVIDPTGKFAYASGWNSPSGDLHAIATLSINPSTGVLSQVGSLIPSPGYPYFSAFDTSGKYLYLPGYNNTSILGYQYNSSNGALIPVPGAPFLSADREPVAIAVVGGKGGPAPPLTVYPSRGGNAGRVTVRLIGGGINDGSQAKLSGPGPDVLGLEASYSSGVLTCTFDLTGKALGPWNVIVTNPDGTTPTLPNGFTITEGGRPELWVDVLSAPAVRYGSATAFYLRFGNRGVVDSQSGLLLVNIPKPVVVSTVDSSIRGSVSLGQIASDTVLTIRMDATPAGSETVAPLFITVPNGASSFTVKARIRDVR